MDAKPPVPLEAINPPRTFRTVREALRSPITMHPEQIIPIRLADLEAQHTVDADRQINAMHKAHYVGEAFLGNNYGFGGRALNQEPYKTMCKTYEQMSVQGLATVMSHLPDSSSFAKLRNQFADKIPADKLAKLVEGTIQEYFPDEGMNLFSGIGDAFEGKGSWGTEKSIVTRFASQFIPPDRAGQNPTQTEYELARSLLAEQFYGGVYDLTGAPAEQKLQAMQFLHEGFAMSMKVAAQHSEYTMRRVKSRKRISKSFGIAESTGSEMDELIHDISEIAAQLVDTDPSLITTTMLTQARKKMCDNNINARLVKEISPYALKLLPTKWERAVTRLRTEIDKRIPPGVKEKYRDAKLWATDYSNTDRPDFKFPAELPPDLASALLNVPEAERSDLTARLAQALQGPTTWDERDEVASPAFVLTDRTAYFGSTVGALAAGMAGFLVAGAGLETHAPMEEAVPRLLAGILSPLVPFSVVGALSEKIGNISANKAVVEKRGKDIQAFMKSEGIIE